MAETKHVAQLEQKEARISAVLKTLGPRVASQERTNLAVQQLNQAKADLAATEQKLKKTTEFIKKVLAGEHVLPEEDEKALPQSDLQWRAKLTSSSGPHPFLVLKSLPGSTNMRCYTLTEELRKTKETERAHVAIKSPSLVASFKSFVAKILQKQEDLSSGELKARLDAEDAGKAPFLGGDAHNLYAELLFLTPDDTVHALEASAAQHEGKLKELLARAELVANPQAAQKKLKQVNAQLSKARKELQQAQKNLAQAKQEAEKTTKSVETKTPSQPMSAETKETKEVLPQPDIEWRQKLKLGKGPHPFLVLRSLPGSTNMSCFTLTEELRKTKETDRAHVVLKSHKPDIPSFMAFVKETLHAQEELGSDLLNQRLDQEDSGKAPFLGGDAHNLYAELLFLEQH